MGYDKNERAVYVRFLDGSLYVYKGVESSEYENLRDAPSVGSYLHRYYKKCISI